MSETKTRALHIHEWLVIVVIAGILMGIGLILAHQNRRINEKNHLALASVDVRKSPLQTKQPLVPSTEMITIVVRGAVKNEERLVVPKGTLLQDLTDRLIFEDDADVSFLRKKRKLRNHEQIIVPKCK